LLIIPVVKSDGTIFGEYASDPPGLDFEGPELPGEEPPDWAPQAAASNTDVASNAHNIAILLIGWTDLSALGQRAPLCTWILRIY
jgi:hypothetical protein